MKKKELSESPKHVAFGVPRVIEIKSNTRELSRDAEEAARQLADVLVDEFFCEVPRDSEEGIRQLIGDSVEYFAQKLQESMFDMRPLLRATKHHVIYDDDSVDDDDEVCIGDHDTIRNNETSAGRPKKWNCVICKASTRYVCSHPKCQAWKRRKDLFGTPLCNHTTGKKNDSGRTCLEIHRNRLREEHAGLVMHHPM